MRKETDFIGSVELPDDTLYGIHAYRARENFPDRTPFHKEWYQALGLVKLACYQTAASFKKAAMEKFPGANLPAGLQDDRILEELTESATRLSAGAYFGHFIVPAIQGGAGTSINMNINEIIANASLLRMGHAPGNYGLIDPFDHANLFQSTNDVVPTALKVAVMQSLSGLEAGINELRAGIEKLENTYRGNLRLAYTQMQQAVPSSYGALFSAWNDALSRDWWRVSKCFERIKLVNLGGGATGSGMALPRYYVMEVVPHLQRLTGLPLTRSENLADTTQNLDVFVEVHATIKALAVNLEKISADTRLLSSDLSGNKEVLIPQKQTGSSIMPGKVNPVIPEYVISSAHKVYSNDMLISNLCGQGNLDLNPYLPIIGHALLDSLKLLTGSCHTLTLNLFSGLVVNSDTAREKLMKSPAIVTALLPHTGYTKAGELARTMKQDDIDVFAANRKLKLIPEARIQEILRADNLLKLGFSLKELE